MPRCLTFVCLALFASVGLGQDKTDPAKLTLDRIFVSKDLDVEPADALQWLPNGGCVILQRAGKGDKGPSFVLFQPATKQSEVLASWRQFIPPGKDAPLAIESFALADDGSRILISTNGQRIWRRSGRADFWVYDIASRELRKLGGDAPPSSLMHAKLSPDGGRVCYVRDNNLYVQDLQDLSIKQLTKDGSADILNGVFDWAYEEEFELNSGFRWSPDSQKIAYWQLDTTGVREFHIVDNTLGAYSKVVTIRYPKVGEKNSAAKIGVVGAAGGETAWLRLPGDPRDYYLPAMDWANADAIGVQWLNRLQNHNELFLVKIADRALKFGPPILAERDSAWVDVVHHVRWLDDGKRYLWLSEKDGWRRLYLMGVTPGGRDATLLTPGDFDVVSVEGVDEKNGRVYFVAGPNDPTHRYLYCATFDGKSLIRLTPQDQPGWHGYQISPDAQFAVHTFSTFDRPPMTEIIALPDQKVIKTLADNKTLVGRLSALKRPASEFLRVDVGKEKLDAWCLKPADFDPAKKYPVLIYVYGEPAGQTVRDLWGGRKHLWHMMLAQQGYVVLSIDNRGADSPRGRDWRKCIYRQVGIQAAEDQANALRTLLKDRPYLDPQRVAIWGWSGGGSMTLNCLFRHGDLYQTGMAVAPVANQRYYDSIYQERYMGSPGDNAKGYRDGSPITHAQKLKGNLLLVHGTGDDNCHYLATEALIDELIAHNKQFELMAYPNRSHSISEGTNTTAHLFGLLTRYLNRNTPPGAR